ncbi:hypothetical protein [Actinocorallia sp. A-T 12471]|uniref:hypothetical protein n=1 Tax=Actinocorallia sp. A-T 12471 TaxID=3089813 RepID=UPI0029D1AF8D|nr:hypothetical protein [Actinocorallia sp. A-T 12471]MDX6738724.1 hypothetical protein [Actinocorallia sp. A-T 12471]
MLRLGCIAGFVLLLGLSGGPATAAPPDPPSRADLVAEALAEDPVQITDHEARVLDPAAARAAVKAALDPLGVPYYVVVTPRHIFLKEFTRPEQFIPILHDRLQKDGLYVVTDTTGNGFARVYGASLPAQDAWRATRKEMAYDAGVVEHFTRFGEILADPDPSARIAAATDAPGYVSRSDSRDRIEMTAMGLGTLVGAVLVGIPVAVSMTGSRRKAALGAKTVRRPIPQRANPSRKTSRKGGNKGGRR